MVAVHSHAQWYTNSEIVGCNRQRLHVDAPGKSRGYKLLAGDPRPCSLPGAPSRCARPPMHIFGRSRGGNWPLLLLSSWCHAFGQLYALPPLTKRYSLTPALSCVLSDGVPASSLFGQCTLSIMCHKRFGTPHLLVAVGACDPSTWPAFPAMCNAAGSKCKSWMEPASSW